MSLLLRLSRSRSNETGMMIGVVLLQLSLGGGAGGPVGGRTGPMGSGEPLVRLGVTAPRRGGQLVNGRGAIVRAGRRLVRVDRRPPGLLAPPGRLVLAHQRTRRVALGPGGPVLADRLVGSRIS